MDIKINKKDQLNVYFNESFNINYQRICNISVTIKKEAFYYYNTALGLDIADAVYIADKVIKALNIITRNRLSRINFIFIDIYNIILNSFNQISSRPGLKHYFFISYDPYKL
jgi:hypothetical protein